MPLFSEQHNLKVIELRLLDMPTDMPDLSPCIQCIQSNAGTLVELTLLGPAELYIAGHLDYRKFSALQRLNIGYIEGEEFPFEPASLPDSLKVLTVHWSDEHSPYTGKLGYFFRSSRLMLEHLNDTEAFHTIMAPGGVVVMETLGKDSSDLHTFSEEWNIQLLLELDSEARDPVHLGHIKGVPFTSTLTVAFLPFEWAIVRITPSRVRYLTMV
ncbi:hypothetical protein PUNSTDRAFT_44024 [Punctularia strigosozonata HHB-11173 SS5]|uniref:uncharacterized protein n=1 Tax=Punctularia strigosozonata (strain HHB-11173) TaxID=741275 RepID=UPI00044180E9|nr:uncharacterized protein PUNSTDRAFT_44024 [Punctularia strigosozonata HHB-11173 SS5]EIN09731.1 hypothetical protein PUNSTDRAFT_44024 [Punctularia strigosozonata HHB-11173 SS5]